MISIVNHLRAALWSFIGIRRGAGARNDVALLRPLPLVLAGVGLAFLFVLGLLALAGAGSSWFGHRALPGPWPGLATNAVAGHSAIPSAASTAASAVPDTMAQRALACTSCHAVQDQSLPDGVVPRIAGKGAGYLFEQMRNFRDGRRVHEAMALLFENLDDRYLLELAQYFAAQQPSRSYRPALALTAAQTQRVEQLVFHGDRVAGLPACSACHGATLMGSAPTVPGLLGLQAGYLAEQLGAWRVGLRHSRAPDCMARVARALPAEDIPSIVQWLQAQPVPAAAAPGASPTVWPLDCGSVEP